MIKTSQHIDSFQADLLEWYDRHARDLPWRARYGQTPNPYHVWMSEIMLQQTQVATVIDYFLKFTNRWKTVHDLANAKEDEVMAMWAGLGYYSRARNLYKCAKQVVEQYNGVFPSDYKALKELPGIGDYTASAVRAIAFNKQATVVDGNVERVMARVFQVEEALPTGKKILKEKAHMMADDPQGRHGCYAQALMDLGATVCTPSSPKCMLCPVQAYCQAYHKAEPAEYPKRSRKKKKPVKYATAFFVKDHQGHFYIQKRGDKGMLAGMYEVPTSEWGIKQSKEISHPLFKDIAFKKVKGQVGHSFTHFDFFIDVMVGEVKHPINDLEGRWVGYDDLDNYGIPTVMKKIIDRALH